MGNFKARPLMTPDGSLIIYISTKTVEDNEWMLTFMISEKFAKMEYKHMRIDRYTNFLSN